VQEQTEDTDCAGIMFKFGPKVLLKPKFALTLKELKEKLSQIGESVEASKTVVCGDEVASVNVSFI